MSEVFQSLLAQHGITGASIAISRGSGHDVESVCVGKIAQSGPAVNPECLFEIASLSKTIASAFAIEFFTDRGVGLDTPVNQLLKESGSDFFLDTCAKWQDKVLLEHLMSHSALNMHYVNGVPLGQAMPNVHELLRGNTQYGYPAIDVLNLPGTVFSYSGGGFLVLQHLIETIEKKPIQAVIAPFMQALGVSHLTFDHEAKAHTVASGYKDDGAEVAGSRKQFPSFAAGALGSPADLCKVLQHITAAFRHVQGSGPISHNTAVRMLYGTDRGCVDFMGCRMGLGVFVAECGLNRLMLHQGANDGFRSLFLHCFDGPDCGKGTVICANGDNKAMFFVAQAAQEVLRSLDLQGLDQTRFKSAVSLDGVPQEQIVNLGYKGLVFEAFTPDLPEEITDQGPVDPLAGHNLVVGSDVVSVTNQRFALATNLVSARLPKWDPALFGRMGKVMDSWESVRHNQLPCDALVLRMAKPDTVCFASLSTKFHLGNQVQFVRLLAKLNQTDDWTEIVPKTLLQGHSIKKVRISQPLRAQLIKVETFPDGGFSRLQLFGSDLPQSEQAQYLPESEAVNVLHSEPITACVKPELLQPKYEQSAQTVAANFAKLRAGDEFDAASLAFGSQLLSVSDEHYAPAAQVLSPNAPVSMFDGFESARSREPGHHEEFSLQLGRAAAIERLELDFTFFVNNSPRFLAVYARTQPDSEWIELVARTFVKPFASNLLHFDIESDSVWHDVKVMMWPDGGINRFKAIAKHC